MLNAGVPAAFIFRHQGWQECALDLKRHPNSWQARAAVCHFSMSQGSAGKLPLLLGL